MFPSREIERCYEVVGGIDGAYDDPSDVAMVIVCKDGIVSRFPKDIFNHPSLNQKPKVKNNNREAKMEKLFIDSPNGELLSVSDKSAHTRPRHSEFMQEIWDSLRKIKPRNNEPWQGKGKRKKPKTMHKKNK